MNKAVNDLEAKVDQIATALFATDEFARAANTANSLSLRLQKGIRGQMARRMAMLNVPSGDDVAALGARLMIMDERLVRIEEMLGRLMQPDAGAKPVGPPRTKRPPSRAEAQAAPDKPKKPTEAEKKTS